MHDIRDLVEKYYRHGFYDVSNSAYAAVVYIEAVTKYGNISATFVTPKSRIVPLNKYITISAIRALGEFYFVKPNLYQADADVFKTSSGRLEKVTTSHDQTRHLHDVWKKTSDLRLLKTSDLRHLEDVKFTTSSRRLIYDVLKTSDL